MVEKFSRALLDSSQASIKDNDIWFKRHNNKESGLIKISP
jgi:hypothetical protein